MPLDICTKCISGCPTINTRSTLVSDKNWIMHLLSSPNATYYTNDKQALDLDVDTNSTDV